MISNNPLFMRDQDHQAKHFDILAAARSATVTSPPTSWRTCAFDNLGGVAFERPEFAVTTTTDLDQLLEHYGLANAPIGYEQAQARADAAVAKMRGTPTAHQRTEAERKARAPNPWGWSLSELQKLSEVQKRKSAIAQMRASRGQR